jgi:hypothetical protein
MGMRGKIRQLLEMPVCTCDGFAGLIRTLLEFGNVFIKFPEQTNLAVWLHRNLFFTKKSPPPAKKKRLHSATDLSREKKHCIATIRRSYSSVLNISASAQTMLMTGGAHEFVRHVRE